MMPAKKYSQPPYSERGYNSQTKWIDCYCPQCEKTHKMRILWIGNTKPRKFCNKCKSRHGYDLPEDLNIHRMKNQITLSR
jgi:Zn ribbon nucleic-acid-binding protein